MNLAKKKFFFIHEHAHEIQNSSFKIKGQTSKSKVRHAMGMCVAFILQDSLKPLYSSCGFAVNQNREVSLA